LTFYLFVDKFVNTSKLPALRLIKCVSLYLVQIIYVIDLIHIGKESNGLDESELIGLDDDSYVVYSDVESLERKFAEMTPKILELKPKDVRELGVSKQSLWNIKNKIKTDQIHRISNGLKTRLNNS